MNLLYDDRWIGDHGIGRFARELLRQLPASTPINLKGSPLGLLSPFLLDAKIVNDRAIFLSPGFNPPYCCANKSIITIHDLMHIKFKEYRTFDKLFYYNFFVKRSCVLGLKILTVSDFTKNEICDWSGIDQSKVVVVGNGVNESFSVIGKKFEIDKPYIFYIGNRKPHKNIAGMLEAFSKSKASRDSIFLLSGNPDKNIQKYIKMFKVDQKVRFTGYVPDEKLPNYYRGATIVLQATYYEGFGLPIIEAMACGVPVITSNVTAMPEVAGGAAHLVDPYNIESISSGIDKVFFDKSLQNKMIQLGVKRSSNFNWEHVGKKVKEVIESIN